MVLCIYFNSCTRQMATVETITADTKEDQENMSHSKDATPYVLNEPSVPINFSELTPSQFGISVESFTTSSSSSSNPKDKSRVAQIKARRRSSVGVRGSPETNSLIRFMAQQRMKTPPTSQTPQLVRSSPLVPRVASTLRQKMASFQSLMDVVESDACDPMPVKDSNTGGCIRTGDYLSDAISCSAGKENNPPTTPTPSKRRRLGPLESCSVEISEATFPVPLSSLKEQEEAICKPQSPGRPPCGDTAGAPGPQRSSPSLPPLVEMKPTGEDDSTRTSAVKKKKQVRFGGPLFPEFFDKNLPPSTPLKKGGTPARAPTPGGSLQLRSVLKTPQRSESKTPQSQPQLGSPAGFGASPTLAMPCKRRAPSEGEDGAGTDGKIIFPSMDEIDSAGTCDTECIFDTQPLNLNSAFYEESLSHVLTELDTKPSKTSLMDVLDECEFAPEEEQPKADVESPAPAHSNRRRRKTSPVQELTSEAPTHTSKRKRKPEESEPVKRSTRSAAKSACGKMKVTSTANRRWNKDVDRSLYGSRAYASKNPTLSPITERLSLSSRSPAARQALSCPAPKQEPVDIADLAKDTRATGDPAVTKALENRSQDSVASPKSSDAKGNRLLGSTVGKRGTKKKVCAVDSEELLDRAGGETEEHFEDQTTFHLEVLSGNPSTREVDVKELCIQISPDTCCTSMWPGKSDHVHLEVSTSDCPTSPEESRNTEPVLKKVRRGRRSSALHEQQKYTEEHQSSCDVDENGPGDQADGRHQKIQSSSAGLEEVGVSYADLAPWQADFNFEDVFKPVATRGQRSVRRSLRNQSNTEHTSKSAGLAWLPRTSPESIKGARRRTRGRRPSAALPVPEETQDASFNELIVKTDD
ncbi:cell division cycle-associated protein 2 isoform 2-T2 [Odontesthes bonariensis]|uniref:cell division cycle-associated protein 2 isoform X2 n=1 Tax=Odontesthes bonariensis TaxID=219752 RepID=UPI003F58D82D